MSGAAALAEWLPDEKSAALVTSPVSMRYLSGLPIDEGLIFISREERLLFTSDNIAKELGGARGLTVKSISGGNRLLDLLIKYGIKRIFIEPDKMTVSEYLLFKDKLHYAEIDTSDALSGQILKMRSVKSEEETAAQKNAQIICDKAYERLLGTARKGMTERQIASLMDFYLADFGSEPTIGTRVLSGENTARLDRMPGDRKIAEGDFVIMEFAARYDGYYAEMCRTVAAGEITPRMENAYNAVSCAIADGLRTLRAGVGGKVADSVCKSTLNAWGMDAYCAEDFAHGIGLELSEPPELGQHSGAQLKAGSVLSVNCAVSAGAFGVKIGDMAYLTEDGCVDFTRATRNLVHI